MKEANSTHRRTGVLGVINWTAPLGAFKIHEDRCLINVLSFNREPEEVAATGPATVVHRYRRLPAASARPTRARRQSHAKNVTEKCEAIAAGS